MLKKLTIIALCLFSFTLLLLLYDTTAKSSNDLVIFYTSNLRGQILPFAGIIEDRHYENAGGIAYIKAFIDSTFNSPFNFSPERAILLDTGDSLFGTAEAYLSMGSIPLQIMQSAGYDAMAIGNMEFEYGFDRLKELIASGNVPMLAANYRDVTSPDNPFSPSILLEKAGHKIGIIGLGHADIARNTRQENIENLEVLDIISSVKLASHKLIKDGAELIILLSHHSDLASRNDLDIIFPDVDVIIGDLIGPPQTRAKVYDRPFVCQTAPSRGGGVGVLKITSSAGKWAIKDAVNKIFTIDSTRIEPNLKLMNEINIVEAKIDELLDVKITTAKGDFTREFSKECTTGNLVVDSMHAAAQTDVALLNSGALKSTISSGTVTLRTLYELFPFENAIVKINLTGWQIENLLEESLTGKTSFLQASGIKSLYSSSNPKGFKIIQTEINNEPIDFDRVYSVAVNDFMISNTFTWPEPSLDKSPTTVGLLRETLETYLKDFEEITPDTDLRFEDIKEIDQLLRSQNLDFEYATLKLPVIHKNSIESDYLRLIAEIIRLETKSDFVFLPVSLIKVSNSKLVSVTPARIISDFSSEQGALQIELKGSELKQIIDAIMGKASNPLCFAGLSLELNKDKSYTILPYIGEYKPDNIYKAIFSEKVPLTIEKYYNISNNKMTKVSNDIRRLFIRGISKRGQVEFKRAFY